MRIDSLSSVYIRIVAMLFKVFVLANQVLQIKRFIYYIAF